MLFHPLLRVARLEPLAGDLPRRNIKPLIDGSVGLAFAPGGKLERVLRFTVTNGKIVDAEIFGEPKRLQKMELAVLAD